MENRLIKLKTGIELKVKTFDAISNKWILEDINKNIFTVDKLPEINYQISKNIQWIRKSKQIHGEDKFDYSQTFFTKSNDKIGLICNKHKHYFEISQASSHISKQKTGCPICSGKNITNKFWIEKSKKIHGENKFDYSLTNFIDNNKPIKLICKIKNHGEFIISHAISHFNKKQGCPICSGSLLLYSEVIEKAKSIHNNKGFMYESDLIEINKLPKFIKSSDKIPVFCNVNDDIDKPHGWFYPFISNHIYRNSGCLKCIENSTKSKGEIELLEFIRELLPNKNIINNDRTILNPQELDIYIPEYKIAIEYNGLHWHSTENNKPNDFHINKTNKCLSKGIQLIHIFEDEWINKKDIVKSRLRNLFGLNEYKIYARNTEIKIVENKETKEFLIKNHIQGFIGAKISLGLYENDELVSLMTFRTYSKKINDIKSIYHFELSRFCNKLNTNVVGSASKLLNYFEKNYKPKLIISYADRRWSMGNVYELLNFELKHISKPNFYYIQDGIRLSRLNFQKHKLIHKYNCDIKITGPEFIKNNLNMNTIFDSGNLVYYKHYKYL